jgi:catechol-2,3-dioxygenase
MSAQPHSSPPPDVSRITRGICEITLETSDLDRLERFYREALGCELLSRQAERVWLACGTSARLGIWSPGEKEFGDRRGRHVHFALSVAPGALNRLCEQLHDLDKRG